MSFSKDKRTDGSTSKKSALHVVGKSSGKGGSTIRKGPRSSRSLATLNKIQENRVRMLATQMITRWGKLVEQRISGKIRHEVGEVLADMRIEFEDRFQRKPRKQRKKNILDDRALLEDLLNEFLNEEDEE